MKTVKVPAVILFLLTPWLSFAETQGDAAVHVFVRVGTIVSVQGGDAVVGGSYQTGEIRVDTEFSVAANVDRLWFQGFASDLFKAGDPASRFSIPHHGGISLLIPRSYPSGGRSLLPFSGGGVAGAQGAEGFAMYPTETREWESSDIGSFTREVIASFSWLQSDPLLPRGTYAGFVKVTAYSLPP